MPPPGPFFCRRSLASRRARLRIDAGARSGYLGAAERTRSHVSESHEERIAREEREWTAPKLLTFGFVFLGICIAIIYAMASL